MTEARFLLARYDGWDEEPIDSAPLTIDDAYDWAGVIWLTASPIRILVYEITSSGAHNLVATRGREGWECIPPAVAIKEVA